MLDPVVQGALVVILATLLKLGANALGMEIDDATLNTLAGIIVVWLVAKFGLLLSYRLFPKAVKNGVLGEDY
jgi:hypothetical protein